MRQPPWPMSVATLVSWGIAGFESRLAVPANRIGYGAVNGPRPKIMEEMITLAVFTAFSVYVLGEPLRRTCSAAMACLLGAVVFIFLPVE